MAGNDGNGAESPPNQPSAATGSSVPSPDLGAQRNVPSGTYFGLNRNQMYSWGVVCSIYFDCSAMVVFNFKWYQALLRVITRHATLPILMAKRCPTRHEYGPSTTKKRPISTPICWQSGGIPSMSYLFLCVSRRLPKLGSKKSNTL